MAWLNRTGLRRLATQYSASKTIAPVVVWSWVVVRIGILGVVRRQTGSALRNSGSIGSMIGWWDATSTSMRRASRSWASTTAITASTCAGGPAITVWRGEAYTARVTSG